MVHLPAGVVIDHHDPSIGTDTHIGLRHFGKAAAAQVRQDLSRRLRGRLLGGLPARRVGAVADLVGKPFADNHTAAFWVAFGTALAINLLIELIRHRRNRRASVRAMP